MRFCIVALEHFSGDGNANVGVSATMSYLQGCLGMNGDPTSPPVVYEIGEESVNRQGTLPSTPPMLPATEVILRRFFAPFNERLDALDVFGPLPTPPWLFRVEQEEEEQGHSDYDADRDHDKRGGGGDVGEEEEQFACLRNGG